jgi:hypothetical protein
MRSHRPASWKKAQQGSVECIGFEAVIPLSLLFMHPAALMRISGFEICFYDDSPSAVIFDGVFYFLPAILKRRRICCFSIAK